MVKCSPNPKLVALELLCSSLREKNTTETMQRVRDMYGNGWDVEEIPDPKCKDGVDYAVSAAVVTHLADVFNWNNEFGKRFKHWGDRKAQKSPSWAASVPPSPERLELSKFRVYEDDCCGAFRRYNLLIIPGGLSFLA